MTISIYYTARRRAPLTDAESAAIAALIDEFSIDAKLDQYLRTGHGLNWESFCVYDPATPTNVDVIFEGATKLPDNSEEAIWDGVQHWAALLSSVRRALPGAAWRVHVDGHDLVWDEASQAYDPAQ